jgi:hypothetical protein
MKTKAEIAREYFEKHGENISKAEIGRIMKQDFPDLFPDAENNRRLLSAAIGRDSTPGPKPGKKERDKAQYKVDNIETDKKVIDFHWSRIIPAIQEMQKISTELSGSQHEGQWSIDTDEQICVVGIGDLQLGSWGTDYNLFLEITREILETPNLYVIFLGDLLQLAIAIKQGVASGQDNLMPPKWQMYFLDSWLQEIKHKVICATWDNHSVMREEKVTGYSMYAEIFKRHTMFTNGIGHFDIRVGRQEYKFAVTHFFRGKSFINRTHAPTRYLTHEGQDRDIAMQGDYHEPGMTKFNQAGRDKVSIVCGSIQTNSAYAKRFFSLTTCATMPCVALDPVDKIMTPYWSVKEWLKANPPKMKK